MVRPHEKKKGWLLPKVSFFFPGKVRFCALFEEYRMNEWKSCFFFSGVVFFFSAPEIEWMNDIWTFPGKKKTQKKNTDFGKKKTVTYAWIIIDKKWFYTLISHFASFLEKNQLSITHFGMNGLWTFPGKKKHRLCFFFRVFLWFRKKKHRFRIWMNEWPTSMPAEKKNTIPLLAG